MITHPEKMMFPEDGITKGEVAAYYETIAPLMLPHLSARPVTMERYPKGIGAKGFMHKDVSKGFPPWLQRVEAPKMDGTVHYPLVSDTRSLLWLANQNCITPHVWPSRVPDLFQPDLCVFDLDPSAEEAPDVVRAAALGVRDLLRELDLPSWVKRRARRVSTSSSPSTARRASTRSRRSRTRSAASSSSATPST